jgi:hypothetical protein
MAPLLPLLAKLAFAYAVHKTAQDAIAIDCVDKNTPSTACCTSGTFIVISTEVTAIAASAFSGCGLFGVGIPKNIVSIGEAAFDWGIIPSDPIPEFLSPTVVVFESHGSLTSIGANAFGDGTTGLPDSIQGSVLVVPTMVTETVYSAAQYFLAEYSSLLLALLEIVDGSVLNAFMVRVVLELGLGIESGRV